MIVGKNYEVSEDGSSIRLFGLRGSKLPGGKWKIEQWINSSSQEPDAVFEVMPQPAYQLLNQIYDRSIAAQADVSGHFFVTARVGVRLFLEGFIQPAHFKEASERIEGFIDVMVPIRNERCPNEICIVDETYDIEGEVNIRGVVGFLIPDDSGWLS